MLELNIKNFPILETDRLLLRRTTLADAEEFFKLRSDVEVMKYIDKPRLKSIDEIFLMIQKLDDGFAKCESIGWAIIKKDNAKLIGNIGFHNILKAHYRTEIGYILNPNYWHNGVMSEAMKVVLDYGFIKMKLHSIEAQVNPANENSKKLLSKFGFIQEGYLKENYYFNGRFLDTEIYSLIGTI